MTMSQNEWDDLIGAVGDPIFIHDESYCLQYVNKAYCEIAGLNASAMLGKPYWNFFPTGNGPTDGCKNAIESKTLNGCSSEEVFYGERTFLSNAYAKKSQDGKGINSIHILSDITDQKKSNSDLIQNNYFLQLVIENMPIRIFWKSCDLLYLGCNTKFAQDAGYASPDDLVGKSDYEMSWSKQAEMFRADDKAAIESKVSKLDYEEESTAPDGSFVWLKTSKLPLSNAEGSISGMLGFYQDITKEKQEHDRVVLEEKRHLENLNKALAATIQALSSTMELRDPYTSGHQNRVANLAQAIAKELHWSEDEIGGLRMAATIHDIGKIAIPSEILTKPSKLSEFEEKLMQEHPERGYQLLKNIEFPWPVAQIVRQHHERIDGSGYPMGLKGNEILPEAKLLAVADSIEAMSTNRPYRMALGLKAALREIKAQSGIKYDAEIVKAALKLLKGKTLIDDLK